MNNRRTFFIAMIFLATITACVLPGLPTASAPVFAPTADSSRVETMVAGTVSAAILQTEQARPTLLPTATTAPTASATSIPETISTASSLTVQVDASTIFTDERAGYEITLPAAWLIMRINEQEYLDAWQLAEAADENIQKSLLSVQDADPNTLRLFAIDAQEGHVQNGFVTTIKFIWDEENPISLENDAELKVSAAAFAATLPGFEVLSTKMITVDEAFIGLVGLKSMDKNSDGVDVVVMHKLAVFNTKTGQMHITLSTVDALKETLFPVFDAMLATIKLK